MTCLAIGLRGLDNSPFKVVAEHLGPNGSQGTSSQHLVIADRGYIHIALALAFLAIGIAVHGICKEKAPLPCDDHGPAA